MAVIKRDRYSNDVAEPILETVAYHIDGSNDEYFGDAPRGASTSDPYWRIKKITYTGNNWVLQYPVWTSKDGSLASDKHIFVWSSVESYTYQELGT